MPCVREESEDFEEFTECRGGAVSESSMVGARLSCFLFICPKYIRSMGVPFFNQFLVIMRGGGGKWRSREVMEVQALVKVQPARKH